MQLAASSLSRSEDAQQMGWDKLFMVAPPLLKHSENMLAELFEAVWGAVYEDCGAKDHVVRECYVKCFPERCKAPSGAE
ncbi:hypothetical protein CVIRNUC_005306 [Coccomyxa viridis]|uniref:RNase III domain-containing protein n=1 Tax=Coccomyxa viridis TaxID=1274662 RepID=A0AAV1I8H4_9CHLO|nr:hypothetical protein CVIRNUC_005306 [Coccomyxa viridis]